MLFATVTVGYVSVVAIVVVAIAADIYVDCADGKSKDLATSLSLVLLLLITRICSHFDQGPCDPCCKSVSIKSIVLHLSAAQHGRSLDQQARHQAPGLT